MTIDIDHTSLSVSDYEKAKAFYAAALAPLGVAVQMEFPMDDGSSVVGIGSPGKPFLWISGGGKTMPHVHIALRAENRRQVDAFYAAAMAAGGTDNGAPGPRPHYHHHYYAAFVLDPDGHNIEAVVHSPDMPAKPARKRAAAKRSAAKTAKKPAKSAAAKKPVRKAAKKPAAKRKAAGSKGRKGRKK
jgi:catechol 2,3-dioxygenase-like lactoylglutathione lyase family enzyme